MISNFNFLKYYLEPWTKLLLLKSLNLYDIKIIKESLLHDPSYRRFTVVLKDTKVDIEFGGVAEGKSNLQAILKASAEAYERICFSQKNKFLKINTDLPYGIGVGYRKKSAIKRAYGEYYERLYTSQALKNNSSTNENHTVSFDTPYGKVFVSIYFDTHIGTGYGFTQNESKESAYRSFLRKCDLQNQVISFFNLNIKSQPKLYNLTPNKAWLKCYCIGHID